MFRKYTLLFFAFAITLAFQTEAQQLPQDNITNNTLPPSPNSSPSGLSETISVNQYTGQLQAGFKLFEYASKSTGLKHSLNINYQGGGIRADDIASSVGTGWSLSTGGVITREIRGLPDDDVEGYNQNGMPIPTSFDASAYHEVINGMYDMEADIFHYSADQYSGSFVMGKDGTIITIPASNVKIQMFRLGYYPGSTTLDSCYSVKYRIDLPDGRKYFYDNYTCANVKYNSTRRGYVSATWYLSMIVSSFDNDTIRFNYTPVIQQYTADVSKVSYRLATDTTSQFGRPTYDTVRLRDMVLNSIQYPDSKTVSLEYANFYRLDLKTDKALSGINITNSFTGSSYSVAFRYSYARGVNYAVLPYQDYTNVQLTPSDEVNYRLMLDGFNLTSGSASLPGYSFSYYPMQHKRCDVTAAIDHWGFLNGRIGGRVAQYSGSVSNKLPSLSACVSSSLKSIGLPHGGSVSFDYELHTTKSFAAPADSTYQKDNLITQTNYDAWYDPDYGYPANALPNIIAPASMSTNKVIHRITLTPGQWPNIASTALLRFQIGNRNAVMLTQILSNNQFSHTDFANNAVRTIEVLADKGDTLSYNIYSTDPSAYSTSPVFTVHWEMYSVKNVAGTVDSSMLVGGLRVKKIIRSDSTRQSNALVTEYKYVVENGLASSGILAAQPVYKSYYAELYNPAPGNPNHPDPFNANAYDLISHYVDPLAIPGRNYVFSVMTSNPQNDLGYTQGSPVGYGRVEEYTGTVDNNKGKTVYTFKTSDEAGMPSTLISNTFPFAPRPDIDFAIGMPLKIQSYNAANVLMKSTYNDYQTYLSFKNEPNFMNLRVGLKMEPAISASGYGAKYYYPVTGKVFPVQTTETAYFVGGDSVTAVKTFTYDTAKMVLRSTMTFDAKGEAINTYCYYPYDFNIPGAMASLNAKGLIYEPVRTEIWKGSAWNKRLINSAVSTFLQLGNGTVKQDASYSLTVAEPVSVSTWPSFNNTQLLQNPQNFTKIAQMDQYDNKGNLVQATAKGVTNATIYDYNFSIPVAQVVNAGIDDIAYTSFEADSRGGWQDNGSNSVSSNGGITGSNSCVVSSTGLLKMGLDPNKSYIVSVWATNSSNIPTITINGNTAANVIGSDSHKGWTLYKAEFNNANSVTVSAPTGRLVIDELRLYPKGAAMTTNTYDPLLGVTSSCDASNHCTYQEYDAFGRLKCQRDMDNNIRKAYDYTNSEPQY